MADIWLISDTHLNHANFINFEVDGIPARPFKTVEEMNETLIENWNRVVKEQDHIWHLGDVIMGPKQEYPKILSRLKGKKRMLLGNHDQLKGTELMKYFQKVELWRIFKEHNFLCTHVPIHPVGFRKVQFNVHGHLHHNTVDDPRYLNVCVEHTGYAPIHLDAVIAKIRKRS